MAEVQAKTRAAMARRCSKLVRRVQLEVRSHLDEALRERQVSTAQLRFLAEVKARPGISGAQVARACAITPQSAQAMMMRAMERGWVVRGRDAENERRGSLTLTRAGERLMADADQTFAELESKVWRGVSVAELRRFSEMLERALENCAQL